MLKSTPKMVVAMVTNVALLKFCIILSDFIKH